MLNRAMLATILYRLEGEPAVTYSHKFSDVSAGQWYSEAIIWANENEIVTGYGNGMFGTNDNITREQMATMLYRYAQHKGYDVSATSDLANFTDTGKISSWAQDAMRWCVAEGLVGGKGDGILDPDGTATRAECATILMKFLNNL